MDKHILETFVTIPEVDRTAELLCATLRDWSFSITTNHFERLIGFDDGRAIIRQEVGGLHLRVEAQDPLTLLGIRSVLQVALSQVATQLFAQLEWHPADGEPHGVTRPRRGTAGCG